ncbi:uncharacterized protein LOC131060178 isoform X2 [Cryptomeria japonica]|uniref:uncharacterized protein LOC131060178 isoform X2 n=1 Tax=Cryptomeria japonica TaxID=3369 RepID=UPI0027D9D9F0|nr:uncharacterized protein LOC131060178 isoform X2 [Cryptomeria japonica]
MEEEKRKKKNKKKKNKNNTSTEEIQVSNNKNKAEVESFEQDTRALEKKNGNAESVAEKVSNGKDAVERKDFEILLQEKLAQFAVIQVSKDDEIKRLKHENQTLLQKEASIEEEVKQLKEEKYSWLQKENCKDEDIERLKDEKSLLLQKEVTTDSELKKLRYENVCLKKEVEQLRESLENLSQDHRQLSTKLIAVQTGFQQLEMEARVRARVEQDVSVATKGVSKRWLVWGSSKDPVAEAVVIAEESCMQKEAAAAIVEKLVCENAELMEKVNQLHTTIDQLNQKCYNVRESRPHANTEENATTPLQLEFKEKSENEKQINSLVETNDTFISIANSGGIETDQPFISVTKDVGTETDQPAIISTNNDDTFYIDSETEVSTLSKDLVTMTDVQNCLSMPDSAAVIGEAKQTASDAVRESAETIIHNEETVPFSDAPLMGAPLRLFSFFKNYVSGADLVKSKNSVSSRGIS